MNNTAENKAPALSVQDKARAIWSDVYNVLTQMKAMVYFTINGGPTHDDDLDTVYAGLCSSVEAWTEKLSAVELALQDLSIHEVKEERHE